jgi:hypothetical protein
MDLASLVVGDMEHYTPYTTKRSETHKKRATMSYLKKCSI